MAEMRKHPKIIDVRLNAKPEIIRIPLSPCPISSHENVEKMNRIDIKAGN